MSKPGKEIKAPGKPFRKGISLAELFQQFPDNATAEAWFAEDDVQTGAAHRSQRYRCRHGDCGRRFSVKVGNVMEGSNLGCLIWAIAIYLMFMSLKGVSSMKLHRDLRINQKSAGHVAHRIRASWNGEIGDLFDEPDEVDESYFGGKDRNKDAGKRLNAGRGTVGKTAVAGVKDPDTNRISAAVVSTMRKREPHSFVAGRVELGATIYTHELATYRGLPNPAQVNHGVGQYVSEQAHVNVNAMESFLAMMKRGYFGTYHRMSPKHLDRYVNEFSGRDKVRGADTIDQMSGVARGMLEKRLRYRDLIAPNGRPSGARGIA